MFEKKNSDIEIDNKREYFKSSIFQKNQACTYIPTIMKIIDYFSRPNSIINAVHFSILHSK